MPEAKLSARTELKAPGTSCRNFRNDAVRIMNCQRTARTNFRVVQWSSMSSFSVP